MSLIRARRERREFGVGKARKPPPIRSLILLLLMILSFIWWLGAF
jgi:hypothetical protein